MSLVGVVDDFIMSLLPRRPAQQSRWSLPRPVPHSAAESALVEASDTLETANARFTADDAKVSEWRANNPEPLNGRARKRWVRQWREYRDATVGDSWGHRSKPRNNSATLK